MRDIDLDALVVFVCCLAIGLVVIFSEAHPSRPVKKYLSPQEARLYAERDLLGKKIIARERDRERSH